jgi:hypothetical protein
VAGNEQGQRAQRFRRAFLWKADARLTPERGARVAVAILLPLVVLEVLGRTRVGSSVAGGTLLGVLFAAFCDLGPSLRVRTRAMGAGILLGAPLILLGFSIGSSWWVAALALTLATFLSGLLLVYGLIATQVGTILAIVFAIALGQASGPAAGLLTALGFLLGGVFFFLLVPVFSWLGWPLHYTPPPPLPPGGIALPPAQAGPLAALLTHLTHRSPLVRFALLRAAGTGLIALLAWGSGVLYPQWAPVVVIASVRPDQMAALLLTTQRVTGTILGAGLADVALAWVDAPAALVALAVAGVFLAFTVIDISSTFFVFFLTFLTLLLLNISTAAPTYIALRVVATLIGGVAALGVSLLAAWLRQRPSAAPSQHL